MKPENRNQTQGSQFQGPPAPDDSSAKSAAEGLKDPNFPPISIGKDQSSEYARTGIESFSFGVNDISPTAKKTLGAFLSKKTEDAKNYYVISSPAGDYQDAVGVGRRGNNLSSIPESQKSESFLPDPVPHMQFSGLGIKQTSAGSKENTFFDSNQLNDLISKTGADPSLSGHDLLKSIPEDGIDQIDSQNVPEGSSTGIKILQSIHAQLSEGNVFNPNGAQENSTNQFVKSKTSAQEAIAQGGMFSVQRRLGYYNSADAEVVTAAELASHISEILANQIRVTDDPKNTAGFPSQLKNYSTNEPLGESSQKYPYVNFRNQKDPGPSFESNYPYNLQSSFPVNGRRVDYSPERKFEDSQGVLAVTKEAILWVISSAFSFFSNQSSKVELNTLKKNRFVALNLKQKVVSVGAALSTTGQPGLLDYGKRHSRRAWNTPNDGNDISSDWYKRIADFDNDVTRAVGRGILQFFGSPEDVAITFEYTKEEVENRLNAQMPANVRQSPGFYLSLMRSLQLEGPTLIGVSDEEIVNSKIYNFVMTVAALGDIVLKAERGMRDVTPSERMLTKEAERFIQPTVLAAGVVKAAGSSNKSIANSGALLGTIRKHISRWSPLELQDGSGGGNPLSLSTFYATNKRVPGVGDAFTIPRGIRGLNPSRENVEMIENALESEFMPFYIHDLRTHDIISMPAFITEFGETFSANYNNVEGIGRQNPVMIYQKTERGVSLGFMLVAFSEEDFDHVWWTVNKLISMCYPQYSAGRIRESGENRFIQPFSQVPAASPMIRLRLGDVFKSNYSKFGLARLFGANSTALAKKPDTSQSSTADALTVAKATAAAAVSGDAGIVNTVSVTKLISSALELAFAKTDAGKFPANFTYDEGGIGGTGVAQLALNYLNNPQSESARVLLLKTIAKISGDQDRNVINEAIQNFEKPFPDRSFFDSSNNAIVRSFETTRGRGVAGFITSLGLDYDMGASTFEIKTGKRAPKIIKISMNFTPLTDLPLGLDYDGLIRNPSHPVGRFAGSFGGVYDDFDDSIGGNLDTQIAAKNYNTSFYDNRSKNGQDVADLALDASFAADDALVKKIKIPK